LVRVVAGLARGRPLVAPPGRTTRPTSDRVREAVFSVLTSLAAVEDADVADLFAGSGALGIEALSRGARQVTFVDSDPSAVRAVVANLAVIPERTGAGTVVRDDVFRFLAREGRWDVVLADPPYRFNRWDELLRGLEGRVGVLVAEAAEPLRPGPAWETMKVKKYGGTVVTVVRTARKASGEGDS
jgi:16S rRNA (guanine966-N2)-methyltransferase